MGKSGEKENVAEEGRKKKEITREGERKKASKRHDGRHKSERSKGSAIGNKARRRRAFRRGCSTPQNATPRMPPSPNAGVACRVFRASPLRSSSSPTQRSLSPSTFRGVSPFRLRPYRSPLSWPNLWHSHRLSLDQTCQRINQFASRAALRLCCRRRIVVPFCRLELGLL